MYVKIRVPLLNAIVKLTVRDGAKLRHKWTGHRKPFGSVRHSQVYRKGNKHTAEF